MKKRNGFTLVELLAVIVILAIILVIAIPQIVKTIDAARLGAFRSTAKLLLSQADKQKLIDETLALDGAATPKNYADKAACSTLAELGADYNTCSIEWVAASGSGANAVPAHYALNLTGANKFAGYTCTNATADAVNDSTCPPKQ